MSMRASAAEASASCGANSACDSASVKNVARKASIMPSPARSLSTLRPVAWGGRWSFRAVLNVR
jgi:hypothetical protein